MISSLHEKKPDEITKGMDTHTHTHTHTHKHTHTHAHSHTQALLFIPQTSKAPEGPNFQCSLCHDFV